MTQEDATQLAALQIVADYAPNVDPNISRFLSPPPYPVHCVFKIYLGNSPLFSREWSLLVDKVLPKSLFTSRPRREWEEEILSRYKSMVLFPKLFSP